MRVEIRRALPEEAELLSNIAWDAKAAWGYAAAQLENWRDGLTLTTQSIESQPTYAANEQGEVLGFYQVNTSIQPVELEHLWIRPSCMRRGIGRALLAHAVNELYRAGVPSVLIDSDPNAMAFYVACGATQIGARAAPIDGEPGRTRPQLLLSTSLDA
jgi:ribosomal protein S18 acetylase RimI-like enzyme